MKNRGPWQEGSQAWGRLEAWYRDVWLSEAWGSGDADRALAALEDSGRVRGLLGQVEFEAVRTARKNGRSWAEIAVKLGVTRQSAWERWRDVDESASTQAGASGSTQSGTSVDTRSDEQGGPSGANEPVGLDRPGVAASKDSGDSVSMQPDVFMPEAEQLIEQAARKQRRRSSVVVPNVIGMTYDVARKVVLDKGLVAGGPD